jgi:hypothetical protein
LTFRLHNLTAELVIMAVMGMRFTPNWIFGLLAVLGSLGSWPAIAPAQKAVAAGEVKATYRVDLAAINLGEFNLTASLNGSAYEMRAKGNFSLLAGILYRASGKTASNGQLAKDGPRPAKFNVSFESGSKKETRELTFAGGAVSKVSLVPRKDKVGRKKIPITEDQLQNVLDPLTAAFLYTRADAPVSDPRVCDRTVPVFDGKQRFDIVLKPKRTQILGNDAPANLSGAAAVCQVKYVPIGGYRPDHPGVKYMMQNEDIEVWLVRVPQTSLYLPYRILMPTAYGAGSATLTEVTRRTNGAAASND